jgi:hypothetical protein
MLLFFLQLMIFHWKFRERREVLNFPVEIGTIEKKGTRLIPTMNSTAKGLSWRSSELISMCSSGPPSFLHYGQHSYQFLKRRRKWISTNNLISVSSDNKYHLSQPFDRFPIKAHTLTLECFGYFYSVEFLGYIFSYLGPVVCLHS